MFKFFIIILSLLLSLCLSIAPLSEGLHQVNPAWCLLTLLFWAYHNPKMVNIGLAFCMGLIMDSLTGSIIGMHAISFVVIIYLLDIFYRQFHMFHVLQQSILIGILVTTNFFILLLITHLVIGPLLNVTGILSAVTSAMCWPLYQSFGRKFNLTRS